MKAFADDKINVIQILNVTLRKVENNVGKEENADYHHFLISYFPTMLSKASFFRVAENQDCV